MWDDGGRASPWSAIAFWEMGLLERGEWNGQWITPVLDEDTTRANPSPMLRREPLGQALGVVRSGQAGDIVVLDVGAGRYEFSYEAPGLAVRLRA